MRVFGADLHVHTALSPCAEAEMTPPNIIGLCLEYGIDIVAVTDHNSAENVGAVRDFAVGTPVTVWPGMEVQTREEVHLITLFDGVEAAMRWQEFIYRHLPNRANRPEIFGEQFILDADGRLTGVCDRLLLTSVSLSTAEVVEAARARGAVVYPAHVDRPAYSYISNLGFAPPPEQFGGVEISRTISAGEALRRFPGLRGQAIVTCSDAHRLSELGPPRTGLRLDRPTLLEFRGAIAGQNGRSVEQLD